MLFRVERGSVGDGHNSAIHSQRQIDYERETATRGGRESFEG